MKKILIFLITLIVLNEVKGQVVVPPGYSGRNSRENLLAGAFNAINITAGDSAQLKIGQWVRAGAVYVDSTGSNKGYYYSRDGLFFRLFELKDTQTILSTIHYVDSLIAANPGGGDIPAVITTNCGTDFGIISENDIIISGVDSFAVNGRDYPGFLSITKTETGRLLTGIREGSGHSAGGWPFQIKSDDKGQTWDLERLYFEPDSVGNWSGPEISSLYQYDKTVPDTILVTYSDTSAKVWFRYSVDDGVSYNSKAEIVTGRSSHQLGRGVKFKGKWLVPLYSFTPDDIQTGVAYLTNAGTTQGVTWLSNLYSIAGTEAGLVVDNAGDTCFIYIRSTTNQDTCYFGWTVDGINWSIPIAINVPEFYGGPFKGIMLPDGRTLGTYRSRDGSVPDEGAVAISLDGRNFTKVTDLIQLAWMYGDLADVGGGFYINLFPGLTDGFNGRTDIYQNYYFIPDCEILVDGVPVHPRGSDLFVDLFAPSRSSGVLNQFQLSNGDGTFKDISGLSYSTSRITFPVRLSIPGAGPNSQISANASSADGQEALANGYNAQADGDFSNANGPLANASGQGSNAWGRNTLASALNTIAGGYATQSTHSYSQIYGDQISSDKANQVQFGSLTANGINEFIVGKGGSNDNPVPVVYRGTNGSDTNSVGADYIIKPGISTDAARGGYFAVFSNSIGATGDATLNTSTEKFRIHADSVEIKTNLFLNRTTVGNVATDSVAVVDANNQVKLVHPSEISGGGAVSSITGTANQIAASAATGAVTLSIPSVFSAPGTITAATGLTVTTGGATITAGGLTVTAGGALITAGGLTVTAGTTTITPLNSIGIVVNSAAGVLSSYAATDHGLQIGNATGQIASLGLGTAGQVLTSNGAGADPSWQAGGGGSSTFVGLTDGPGAFTGNTLKVVRVNAGETALEYVTLAGGGDALKADPLSQFAATTSAQFAGVLSNETGTGLAVFGTAPTFTTSIITPLLIGGTGTTDDAIFRTTSGAGTTGADFIFQSGSNGATELVRILNNGNVGLGIAAPSAKLHMLGDIFLVDNTSNPTFLFGDATTAGNYARLGWNSTADRAELYTEAFGTTQLNLLESGFVGVNTSAPDKTFEVNAGTTGGVRISYNDADGSAANYFETTIGSTGNTTFNLVGTSPKLTISDPVVLSATTTDNTATKFVVESSDGTLNTQTLVTASAYVAVDSLMSGQYTPTLANVTNVAGTTAVLVNYQKIGSMVHVQGVGSCTVTAGSTFTTMSITLPFASAMTLVTDCAGSGTSVTSAASTAAYVTTNTTTDVAEVNFYSGTGSHNIHFSFTYKVK